MLLHPFLFLLYTQFVERSYRVSLYYIDGEGGQYFTLGGGLISSEMDESTAFPHSVSIIIALVQEKTICQLYRYIDVSALEKKSS